VRSIAARQDNARQLNELSIAAPALQTGLVSRNHETNQTTKATIGESLVMRKAIITITGAAFLGMAFTAVTPAPASAFWPIFFAPMLAAKKDPNFKPVNPYAPKKASKHHKAKK
jgi:hypothetical protein